MTTTSVKAKFAQFVMVPILVAAVGAGIAHAQDHRDDRDHGNYRDGNQRDQGNRDHGNRDHGDRDHGDRDRGDRYRGNDFHFRDEDRGRFQSHYQRDADRWSRHRDRRPHFERGERIPYGYRFQPVPRAYYSEVPPPPPGYEYGYYDGYVVAYNPTTRIIADVMDLVGAAVSR